MKKRSMVALRVVGGIFLLGLVGFVTNQVGNSTIGIRRVQPIDATIDMTISTPIVPGVATIVRWEPVSRFGNIPIEFMLRTAQGETSIGKSVVSSGQARVLIACDNAVPQGSIVMRDVQSNEVLGSQSITMFSAGPDCF